MITRTQRGCRAGGWWLAVVVLGWLSMTHLSAADIELATLKSGTDVFTNVTIYGQSETDLFIKHARGLGNVKISSLDNATLRKLKLGGATPEEETTGLDSGKVAATVETVKARLGAASWKTPSQAEVQAMISRVRPSPSQLAGVLAGVVIGYLLLCVLLRLICVNAGSRPGLMIWFPVLQMFPLLRAAQMSAWWFVAFLIPLVGVVAHIVWCVKISKACGKGGLVALFLILPVTNLLAFLYLALSRGDSQPVERAMPLQRHTMVLGDA